MKTSANLLPFEHRRRALLGRLMRRWAILLGCTLLLMLGVTYRKHTKCLAAREQLKAVEAAYAPLEDRKQKTNSLQAELNQLHARDTLLQQFQEERSLLTLMAIVSESAERCEGRLRLENLEFHREETTGQSQGAGPHNVSHTTGSEATDESMRWGSLTLEGHCPSNADVAKFVVGLQRCELFSKVELRSSTADERREAGRPSFLVECEIR